MSTKGPQTGFTLVEILVGLLIGLFLTAGMIQMYVSNKQTYRFSDALSRIQENGRYALAYIAQDMRMGDFWGCTRDIQLLDHLNAGAGCTTPSATSTNAMAGIDGPSGAPDQPDRITLRGSVGSGLAVATGTTKEILKVEGTVDNAVLKSGDIALISDCRQGDLFQVTGVNGSGPTTLEFEINPTDPPGPPGNATEILSNAYDDTAMVYPWREVAYFLQRPGGQLWQQWNVDNALFIRENACGGGTARELVEGVENMQITYGEDADGDGSADRYVPFDNVADMDRVVSVRISLLLASAADNLIDHQQQIRFNGQTFTAPDHRIYQVMTATIAVRNRPL